MKKVSVTLAAGRSAEAVELAAQPAALQFIFGLAPAGLSPLERALSEKRAGQQVVLLLKKSDLGDFFGHITPPMVADVEDGAVLHLKIVVTAVAAAEGREVVKAMAQMAASHGCCGNH